MPNKDWTKLSNLQLGRYAEYYAKMEFASYGCEVYTCEVDDHGVDFIVKTKKGRYLEIQSKSLFKSSYTFMQKTKWDIENKNLYLILLIFKEGYLPETYLIPASDWQNPNQLLSDKNYDGLKSKPEYGVNLTLKNVLLQKYKIDEQSIADLDGLV